MGVVGWIILWGFALIYVIAAATAPFMVGRPREPYPQWYPMLTVIIAVVFIYALLVAPLG